MTTGHATAEVRAVLQALEANRALFHSEADLQLALGWEWKSLFPRREVRLEVPFYQGARRKRLDMFVHGGDRPRIGVELKYRTTKWVGDVAGEAYHLADQAAQDTGRYSFWKDVERLEGSVAGGSIDVGVALLLTNDGLYWKKPLRVNCNDVDFRLHTRSGVGGSLKWSPHSAPGSIRGMEAPVRLMGRYDVVWSDWAQNHEEGRGPLRMMVLLVGAGQGA